MRLLTRLKSTRFFSLLTALLAGLILFKPGYGPLQVLAWGPKLYVSALAPQLAWLGSLLALLGLKRKDAVTVGAGLVGAAIAARHTLAVTASRDQSFARAFGPDWKRRLPNDLRPHLRQHRWRPFYRRRRRGPLHQNVRYGRNSDSGRPLMADLMRPPPGAPKTGTAMIFVHGGGWWYGRKNILKFPYFQRLCAQGYLVMDADYTLAPHSSIPGMVKDVKQAILWLKRHAGAFGFEPERIVLTGQSAGSTLCMLAAYAPQHPLFQPAGVTGDASVSGLISYAGPPDMIDLHHDIEARFVRFFPNRLVNALHRLLELATGHGDSLASGIASVVGGAPADIPDVYRQLSPLTYVNPTCPPTLLLQGTHDLLVNYHAVERLYRRLQQANVPVIYIPFPNCNHAFEAVLPRLSPPAQTAAYYTERFLALVGR